MKNRLFLATVLVSQVFFNMIGMNSWASEEFEYKCDATCDSLQECNGAAKGHQLLKKSLFAEAERYYKEKDFDAYKEFSHRALSARDCEKNIQAKIASIKTDSRTKIDSNKNEAIYTKEANNADCNSYESCRKLAIQKSDAAQADSKKAKALKMNDPENYKIRDRIAQRELKESNNALEKARSYLGKKENKSSNYNGNAQSGETAAVSFK